MQLTAVLTSAEEGGFVAMNPETGTTTQGETIYEAMESLKEATARYLEEFSLLTMGLPCSPCPNHYMPRLPRISGTEVIRVL